MGIFLLESWSTGEAQGRDAWMVPFSAKVLAVEVVVVVDGLHEPTCNSFLWHRCFADVVRNFVDGQFPEDRTLGRISASDSVGAGDVHNFISKHEFVNLVFQLCWKAQKR